MKKLIGKRGLKLDQADEIVAALKAVNGRGYDYAITEISEVIAIARDAEAKLEAVCLPESRRVGSTAKYRSAGGTKPYKRWTPHRAGTRLELRRFKEGWRVMWVAGIEVYGGQGERLDMTLDAEQRAIAEQNVFCDFSTRREYDVAKPQPTAEQAFDDCYLVVDDAGHIHQAA